MSTAEARNDDEQEVVARPFVKWAGGKGQLLPELKKRVPKNYNRYFEPFVGGGAMFFALRPEKAVLSDVNEELINTYTVIRDDLPKLCKELAKHKYEEKHYYKVRDMDRDPLYASYPPAIRAARFIYLNKTCFNGLYRVNRNGYFNTPFGRYTNPTIFDQSNLEAVHGVLQDTELYIKGFDEVLSDAKKGDFVYFDPPYSPVSETADFTSYTKDGFGDSMQQKLFEVCRALDKKGVSFLLSNSANDQMKELYSEFIVDIVPALRAINSKGNKRGSVSEILVRNYTE